MRPFLAAFAALGLAVPAAAQDLFRDGQFDAYQPDPANGRVVFNAGGCAACHGIDGDDTILAGGRAFETAHGTFHAPNITPDPTAGIGGWSRTDFLNALLRGVAPDGRAYYGAVFPFPAFARMRPEDALDLQAYIATLPASDRPSNAQAVNSLDHALLMFYSNSRAPLTPLGDAQLDRGAYLAEALGHCSECHSPREFSLSQGYRVSTEAPYSGGVGFFGGYAWAINAQRFAEDGVTAEDFVNGAMAQGLGLNGLPMRSDDMRRISRSTARLSHEDRVALYAYLTGTPVDPSSVARIEPVTAEDQARAQLAGASATVVAPGAPLPAAEAPRQVPPDTTGATELAAQVAALCTAPEPATATPAAVPAATPARDPALDAAMDAVMQAQCRTCHGPGMTDQGAILIGGLNELARNRRNVVPGDHAASRLWESIASGRMPTPGLPRVSAQDLGTIAAWIDGLAVPQAGATASTPSAETNPAAPVTLPRYVGGDFIDLAAAAVTDLASIDALDLPFIRYVSLANVPLPAVDCTTEGGPVNPVTYLHAAVNKLVNSVSRGPVLSRAEPVPGTNGALMRLDMRAMGWTRDDWESLTTGVFTRGSQEAGFTRESWERLAEIYPYAVDPASNQMLRVMSEYTQATVPILNADWFARHGTEAPYYDLLLRLPPHIRDLEARMGVDVASEITGLRTIRAGFLAQSSGVSDHNRLLERFDLPRGGYYWKSYDFAGDEGEQSLLEHPDGPPELAPTASGTAPFEHDGGEMIFSLPNGLQGYYLSLADGTRIFEGPTQIVSFRRRPVGRGVEIVNARSCFTCHVDGLLPERDEIRAFIESSPRFSFQQREVLLRMYPEQATVDRAFQSDIATYLSALERLGATELSPAGRAVSLRAPGGHELITWLADHRFERLDEQALARLFYLSPAELRRRGDRIADPYLMQTMRVWLNRFDQGLMVTLEEVDAVWADMLPHLTLLRPLHAGQQVAYQPAAAPPAAAYTQAAATAVQQAVTQAQQPYAAPSLPNMQPPMVNPNPLQLTLNVPRQTVRVNELLTFDVTATRACQLQVLYVAANREVLELSERAVGPAQMQAGERRQIPWPAGGRQLRFDAPGTGEFLLAFCREAGSAMTPLTPEEIVRRAGTDYLPLTRTIVEEAVSRALNDAGRSAFASVSIDVLP